LSVQKLRRCKEERWDFTEKDGNFFPIHITDSGAPFGFCPGKATWDQEVMEMFKVYQISAETGNLWVEGGIADQPDWFIDVLGWFISRYDQLKFMSRARAILGDGKSEVRVSGSNK
jgi:hypothetical protein